ncbi:MAG: hypothetical protein FWF28_08840 [Micrococcales bacterium]|nr:hypothetical protein [Micrococcales bacterium]
MLGHSTVRAAMIYAHRVDGSGQRLAAAMNGMFSPGGPGPGDPPATPPPRLVPQPATRGGTQPADLGRGRIGEHRARPPRHLDIEHTTDYTPPH